MIEVIWPDGALHSGATYRELEDNIRAGQWRGFATRLHFRSEMSARCAAWCGKKVPVWGTSRQFITRLADAGLFMLVDANNK